MGENFERYLKKNIHDRTHVNEKYKESKNLSKIRFKDLKQVNVTPENFVQYMKIYNEMGNIKENIEAYEQELQPFLQLFNIECVPRFENVLLYTVSFRDANNYKMKFLFNVKESEIIGEVHSIHY